MSCHRKSGQDSLYFHDENDEWREIHIGKNLQEINTIGELDGDGWSYVIQWKDSVEVGNLYKTDSHYQVPNSKFNNENIYATHFWGNDHLVIIGRENLYLYNFRQENIVRHCPVPKNLVTDGSSYTNENLWLLADSGVWFYESKSNTFMEVHINLSDFIGSLKQVWHDTYTGELYIMTYYKLYHMQPSEVLGDPITYKIKGNITHNATFHNFRFLPSRRPSIHGSFLLGQKDILVQWNIKSSVLEILAVDPLIKKVQSSAHGAYLYLKANPASKETFDRIIRVNGNSMIDFILDSAVFSGAFIESFQLGNETDSQRKFIIFMKNQNNNKITISQNDYDYGAMYNRYVAEIETVSPGKYEQQHLVTYNEDTGFAMVCGDDSCTEINALCRDKDRHQITYKTDNFGYNAVWNTPDRIVMMAGFDTKIYKKDVEKKTLTDMKWIQKGGSQIAEVKSSNGGNLIYGNGMVWNFMEVMDDGTDGKFIINNAYDQITIKNDLVLLKNPYGISIHDKKDLDTPIYKLDYKTPETAKDPFLYVKKDNDLSHVYTTILTKFHLSWSPQDDKVMLRFKRKDHQGNVVDQSEHHLTHPVFNFMRKEKPQPMRVLKERILAPAESESVILDEETAFLTKDNLRLTVYVAAFISVVIAILGSVWIVLRVIWKQGKEEFIENPVRVSNAPGRIQESYAQREERQERYRDAKYKANIDLYNLINGNSMYRNGVY